MMFLKYLQYYWQFLLLKKSFYKNEQKNRLQIPTTSVISVIASYVDNQYKKDNYKLLDVPSNERITNDNINEY